MSDSLFPKAAVVASMVPPAHSGAGYSALKYAARLDHSGQLALLLTAAPKPVKGWSLGDPRLMRILEEKTVHVGKRTEKRIKTGLPLFAENVRRLCGTFSTLFRNRKNYSIVHCFSPTWLSLFACLAAKFLRKKLIVEITLLGGDCPESVTHNRWRFLHQRKMIQFRLADAIVCVSPAIREACLRAGFPERKLFLIPRAVDVERFAPVNPETKAALRRKLNLPQDRKLILFVGGILLRKGIDRLLDAFVILGNEYRDTALVLVGPASDDSEGRFWQQRILELTKTPGFQHRIFSPGRCLNVDEYMAAADLLVLPSRKEGFPNVVVEAMASGLPSVVSELSGTAVTILDDGVNGFIPKGETPQALAAALRTALEAEREHPGEMGTRAREKVLSAFSPKRVDHLYKNLYSELSDPTGNIVERQREEVFPSGSSSSLKGVENEL